MIKISRYYASLTAHERLRLVIEAMGRQDDQECRLLGETCPRFTYTPQLDLAYTSKFLALKSTALLHGLLFHEQRATVLACIALKYLEPSKEIKEQHASSSTTLLALAAGWKRFCDNTGFDADKTMIAFGVGLDPKLVDIAMADIEVDEAIIDQVYQMYLNSWNS